MNDSTSTAQYPNAGTPTDHNHTCPNCGYCPHCGRSNRPEVYPWYPEPYIPSYPVYPYPHWYYTPNPMPNYTTITCESDAVGTLTVDLNGCTVVTATA